MAHDVLTRVLLSFAVTLLSCPIVMILLRRWRMVDTPSARSSHDAPTLRGGGLAVALGAIMALSLSPVVDEWRFPLLLASGGFGLLGLADDFRSRAALARLGAQVVVATLTVPLLLRHLTGPAPWRALFACGAALWLISYVNGFNFMDGINGISAVQVLVAGVSWCVIGHIEGAAALAWGGAIIAACAAGFMPFNFPRARIFLGDVGSYFFGAWLAVLVVVGLRSGVPAEAMLAPISLTLADTSWTLVRRVRRGKTWYQAHAEHVYQRLVRSGLSHTATTLLVGVIAVVCSALGMVALADGALATRVGADVLVASILTVYLLSPGVRAGERRVRRASARELH